MRDLDGNGIIDAADDPSRDLDRDGRIDVGDRKINDLNRDGRIDASDDRVNDLNDDNRIDGTDRLLKEEEAEKTKQSVGEALGRTKSDGKWQQAQSQSIESAGNRVK